MYIETVKQGFVTLWTIKFLVPKNLKRVQEYQLSGPVCSGG